MPGSGSQTRARTEVVMVRLLPDEKERFAAVAEAHHVSLPEFFRLAASFAEMQEAVRG